MGRSEKGNAVLAGAAWTAFTNDGASERCTSTETHYTTEAPQSQTDLEFYMRHCWRQAVYHLTQAENWIDAAYFGTVLP